MAGCPLTALGLLQRQTSVWEWIVGGAVALALAALVWEILKPKSECKGGLPLPPGSTGWRETLDFIRSQSEARTPSTPSFMQARRKLHGDVYKTRLLGVSAVVVGGPEGQKFVSSNDGKLLESTAPSFAAKRIGENSLFILNGDFHKRVRKAMQEPFSLGSLKSRLSSMESLTLDTLKSWEGKEVIVMEETTKFTFSLILDMVISLKPGPEVEYLWEKFKIWGQGGLTVPLNIPGTPYYKSLQARKPLIKFFQEVIDSRRKAGIRSEGVDILDLLLKPVSAGQETLSDNEIVDNIIFVLFAGYDTTATSLTSIIRRLFQDPHVLSILTDEHDRIRQGLQGKSEVKPLTWDDIKQMTYTTQVIYEATRTSSIGDTIARKSLQDLEFQGYRIPKGWKVFLDRDSVNFDTRTFEDPKKFNPARFKNGVPTNFSWTPFGSGPHMCLGIELAKLELYVFVHHLVTSYRWRVLTDDFAFNYGGLTPRYRSGIPTVFERR